MKILIYISVLLILNNFSVCFGQNSSHTFPYAYSIVKVRNSIGLVTENDLPFNFISFQPKGTGEIIPKIMTNCCSLLDNLQDINFSIASDSLTIITIHYATFKYKISTKSERELILTNGDKIYYLERTLKIENENIFMAQDTIQLKKFSDPVYNGSLFEYFYKNIPLDLQKDTSYLVKLDFILKKEGTIDSIEVLADSIAKEKLICVLKPTNKKWVVAKVDGEKIDTRISFFVFIQSHEINGLKTKNAKKIIKTLFNKGFSAFNSGDNKAAIRYFSDCEKIFDSFNSLVKLSTYLDASNVNNINKMCVDAIINLATIYNQKGLSNEACSKWKKVANLDDEAYNNYKNICNK